MQTKPEVNFLSSERYVENNDSSMIALQGQLHANKMHDAHTFFEQKEPVVQTLCVDIHIESDIFGDAQLGQSLLEVTVIALEMDAFFFDVFNAFEVYIDLG